MATTSFNKAFVVRDEGSIRQFKLDAENPARVKFSKVNYAKEEERGLASLDRLLSRLKAS